MIEHHLRYTHLNGFQRCIRAPHFDKVFDLDGRSSLWIRIIRTLPLVASNTHSYRSQLSLDGVKSRLGPEEVVDKSPRGDRPAIIELECRYRV